MPPKLKEFLQRWLINTLAVFVAAKIVPGIWCDSFTTLLVTAFLLGVLNAFLRPLLVLLALPLVIITFGIFFFIINGLLLYLVAQVVKGFHIDSFWAAFWGALVITFVTLLLNSLTGSGGARIAVHRGPRPPNRPDDGDGPVIDVCSAAGRFRPVLCKPPAGWPLRARENSVQNPSAPRPIPPALSPVRRPGWPRIP
jgi:putative membrane protein